MALTATLHNVDIDLADADRQVYDTIALKVARHPSESEEHLVARVLVYAMEYTEGLAFSNGVSDPDEPTMAIRDLTGRIQAWIDVGVPEASRVHRAAKASPRVAVYTHKDPGQLVSRLVGERIHRVDALELYAIDRRLVEALVERLDRRVAFALSITDRELYVSIGSDTLTGAVTRLSLP